MNDESQKADIEARIQTVQEAFEEQMRNDKLAEHFVEWDQITRDEVREFETFIDTQPIERQIHRYLESDPHLLVQPLSGGHGRYVISRSWLGRDAEIDFLIAERMSGGLDWIAVELEDLVTPLYNEKGDTTKRLKHAMQQITGWRIWLEQNLGYAERPKSKQGLGLENIGANPKGLILMGREADLREGDGPRRRQVERDSSITIHTYDWLIRHAYGRAEALERAGS